MISNHDIVRNHYFDDMAEDYHHKSLRGFWRLLREQEANSLFSLLGDLTGKKVLDLGCGAGFYARKALSCGAQQVVAVDQSEKMLAALPREQITTYLGDAQSIELAEAFDKIVCAGLLEFVDNPLLVLRNARLHANAECDAIFHIPTKTPLGYLYKLFHQGHGFRIQLFDVKSFRIMAENAGWKVEAEKKLWPFSLQVLLRVRP